MAEIQVEGEPWTGLVVLSDVRRQVSNPGYFVLARSAEWNSENEQVTVWRGPRLPDEKVSRTDLFEMECRTVLVDESGHYTCPPIIDELKDAVEELSEEVVNEMTNQRAAESWSYVEHEQASEKYGTDEVFAIATCGDAVAVNGEQAYGKRAKVPRGYVKTEEGGRDPSGQEEEVDLDSVADVVAYELSSRLKREVSQDDVRELLHKIYNSRSNYVSWVSDAIDIDVYIPRRVLRKWEEEEELRLQRRQIEESQRRAAEHNRRVEEERQERQERLKRDVEARAKMKKGGWPSPKDWSPQGRLPWERGEQRR
jgi:hypothetical protein